MEGSELKDDSWKNTRTTTGKIQLERYDIHLNLPTYQREHERQLGRAHKE